MRIEAPVRLDRPDALTLEQAGEGAVHEPDAILEAGLPRLGRRVLRPPAVGEEAPGVRAWLLPFT